MAKNSIFKNIVYQSILTFFNFLLPFFTGTYVVRVLSVESYGVFNTASAYLTIFVTIGSLAIGPYGIRELSQCPSKEQFEKIYSELFIIRAFCNIVTFSLCLLCLNLAVKEHFWIYAILSFQIISNAFGVEWVNSAKEEFGFITVKTIIIRLLYVVLLVCWVRDENDVLQYCLAIAITEFLNNFVSFVFISKNVHLKLAHIRFGRHFSNILILTLSNNIGILYTNLDKVYLAWYCGEKSVSYYTITVTIYSVVTTLFSGITGAVTPRLAFLNKKNINDYVTLLKYTLDSYMFLVIPTCIGVAVLAPEILTLYGSEKYLEATAAMVVAGVYRIFMCYEGVISTLVLYQFGKEKTMFFFLLIFGIGNLISNIILAQLKLLTEVTTIVASIIINILMVLCYIVYIKNNIDKKLVIITSNQIRYFVVSLLFIPISLIVRHYVSNLYAIVILMILSCALVYSIIMYIFKDSSLMIYIEKGKQLLEKIGGKRT